MIGIFFCYYPTEFFAQQISITSFPSFSSALMTPSRSSPRELTPQKEEDEGYKKFPPPQPRKEIPKYL